MRNRNAEFSDCDDCDWLLRSADYQDDSYQRYKDAGFRCRKAELCATPDKSVNVEGKKGNF
jgi:hypothetical protein